MKRAVIAAALIVLVANPASAEVRQITLADDATWQHQRTQAQFPPTLDGFSRDWVGDFGTGETDILATYQDRASGTTATLYVFRAGLVDVSLWQDRVYTAMKESPNTGPIIEEEALRANFSPPQGGGADSGYRIAAPSRNKGVASTGFGMFPHDGWLIAVRMSSARLTAQELDRRIDSFMAAVPLPAGTVTYPAAAPLQPCPTPLSFKKKAKQKKTDLGTLLIVGALASARDKLASEDQGQPLTQARFCKESDAGASYGVYRADDTDDSYVLALGDAGVSVTVGRSDIGSLLNRSSPDQYWPILSDSEATRIYAPFDRLPSPEQVLGIIQSQNPVSTVSVDAKGETAISLPEAS